MDTLVAFIKQYALDHYEDGGWDVIVECYSDNSIEEALALANATSESEAIAAFGFVEVYADRQADARNSAF